MLRQRRKWGAVADFVCDRPAHTPRALQGTVIRGLAVPPEPQARFYLYLRGPFKDLEF